MVVVTAAIGTACSSPNISGDAHPPSTSTAASVLPTSSKQASDELSSGLTKQQQYLNKYHQLVPQDKTSDDNILAEAKKFCDEAVPPSTALDAMSQLVAFWQQLNCPK
jgi:hypothetical protein